jgi:rhodanese-related sulfurtransferase
MERLLEYVANHPLLAWGLIALVGLVAGYEIRQRVKASADVGPLQAVSLINDGAVVLDVRAAAQFDKGHILDARSVPSADLDAQAASLEKYKDASVIVYCDNGMASGKTADALRGKGFSSVVNLRGGLAAWRQENLPVVKGGRKGRRKDSE